MGLGEDTPGWHSDGGKLLLTVSVRVPDLPVRDTFTVLILLPYGPLHGTYRGCNIIFNCLVIWLTAILAPKCKLHEARTCVKFVQCCILNLAPCSVFGISFIL